jgi:hypothetical protein
MASGDELMNKYAAVDKTKHITSVIPQKFEIIRRLSQNGKSQSVVKHHGTLEHQLSI